jgi:hypothetical protein
VEAKQTAAKTLKLAPTSQGVEVEAALAFATAGETAREESLAQDLNKRFPEDTQIQSLWLSPIRAHRRLTEKIRSRPSRICGLPASMDLGQILFIESPTAGTN